LFNVWDRIEENVFASDVTNALAKVFPRDPPKTAIFRQVNKDIPRVHHDALEFPDGTCVLLTDLREGQEATVLQLPAQPKTPAEEAAQKRVTYVG
jgi:hypothetical protein